MGANQSQDMINMEHSLDPDLVANQDQLRSMNYSDLKKNPNNKDAIGALEALDSFRNA